MDPLTRRVGRLEEQHGMSRRAAYCFVPIGIAHSDREAGFLAEERRQRGLAPDAELVAFCWGEVQP